MDRAPGCGPGGCEFDSRRTHKPFNNLTPFIIFSPWIIYFINIPEWIRSNNNYCLMCLRGLFDTDGCIYIDKHVYKNSNYRSINIDFKSASNELLKSIFMILKSLGMHPLLSSPRSVRLRRRYEIDKFFEIIGSSNQKNIVKYRDFTQLVRYPSGRTEAVSKTVEAR